MLCPRIIDVEALDDYKIKLQYETGETKVFNVLPYMSGKWFEELYNTSYFKTVHLATGGKGIEWAHGQDIAPHELYDMATSE